MRRRLRRVPIVGRVIRYGWPAPPLLPLRVHYLVRHPRLAVWWRDPHRRYSLAGDPRSDWTPDRARAYRFSTAEQARAILADHGIDGVIVADHPP